LEIQSRLSRRDVQRTQLRPTIPPTPSTTYISLTEIHLDLRQAQNLKEKRKVVSSLKAQLRHRFVAAVAEIDAHDERRRAVLLCALVGGSEIRERAAELERFVEARCPDGCSFERDLLTLDDVRG
jgi:uncharacterized protein YlxP (DUF503 family)